MYRHSPRSWSASRSSSRSRSRSRSPSRSRSWSRSLSPAPLPRDNYRHFSSSRSRSRSRSLSRSASRSRSRSYSPRRWRSVSSSSSSFNRSHTRAPRVPTSTDAPSDVFRGNYSDTEVSHSRRSDGVRPATRRGNDFESNATDAVPISAQRVDRGGRKEPARASRTSAVTPERLRQLELEGKRGASRDSAGTGAPAEKQHSRSRSIVVDPFEISTFISPHEFFTIRGTHPRFAQLRRRALWDKECDPEELGHLWDEDSSFGDDDEAEYIRHHRTPDDLVFGNNSVRHLLKKAASRGAIDSSYGVRSQQRADLRDLRELGVVADEFDAGERRSMREIDIDIVGARGGPTAHDANASTGFEAPAGLVKEDNSAKIARRESRRENKSGITVMTRRLITRMFPVFDNRLRIVEIAMDPKIVHRRQTSWHHAVMTLLMVFSLLCFFARFVLVFAWYIDPDTDNKCVNLPSNNDDVFILSQYILRGSGTLSSILWGITGSMMLHNAFISPGMRRAVGLQYLHFAFNRPAIFVSGLAATVAHLLRGEYVLSLFAFLFVLGVPIFDILTTFMRMRSGARIFSIAIFTYFATNWILLSFESRDCSDVDVTPSMWEIIVEQFSISANIFFAIAAIVLIFEKAKRPRVLLLQVPAETWSTEYEPTYGPPDPPADATTPVNVSNHAGGRVHSSIPSSRGGTSPQHNVGSIVRADRNQADFQSRLQSVRESSYTSATIPSRRHCNYLVFYSHHEVRICREDSAYAIAMKEDPVLHWWTTSSRRSKMNDSMITLFAMLVVVAYIALSCVYITRIVLSMNIDERCFERESSTLVSLDFISVVTGLTSLVFLLICFLIQWYSAVENPTKSLFRFLMFFYRRRPIFAIAALSSLPFSVLSSYSVAITKPASLIFIPCMDAVLMISTSTPEMMRRSLRNASWSLIISTVLAYIVVNLVIPFTCGVSDIVEKNQTFREFAVWNMANVADAVWVSETLSMLWTKAKRIDVPILGFTLKKGGAYQNDFFKKPV